MSPSPIAAPPGSDSTQPVSIRPQYALQWSSASFDVQQCAEDALISGPGAIAAIVSGHGQYAADVALAACSSLAEVLSGSDQQLPLVPDALVAAFEQCHAKLLQQAAQQQQQQQQQPQDAHQHHQHHHPLDVSHSGASCLLVCLDQDSKQVLAASAGLCHAVMARSAPGGALTVLELSPRLALGYNVAETSRLDAEGSSICYSYRTLPTHWAPQQQQQQHNAGAVAQAAPAHQHQQQQASCPEPVLVGRDGQPFPGVRASRLLGYTSASSAGVTATPVVTSWRLSGEEAFVVLGSPGLWAAMNPAEVVDYVAAALAGGACSVQPSQQQDEAAAASSSSQEAPAQELAGVLQGEEQQQQALRPDAAVLLSDLLTLEAQERLKLRLTDISTLLGLGGTAGGTGSSSSTAHQVVPDVTAVVLLLPGPLPEQKVPVDKQLLQTQLSTVTRGCRSNAEAQALQARWYSSASASTCSSSTSVVAISSSSSNSSSSIAAPASMSSSADSTCSTSNSGCMGSASGIAGAAAAAAMTAAFPGIQAASREASAGRCPAQVPPCPALSCLLPVLSVAGHCWPSAFWPAVSSAVKVPAGLTSLSRKASLAAAASTDGAAGAPGSCEDGAAASGGPAGAAAAARAFTLSPRLSIELDVTHRLGSSGSIGSLAAQCAAADAAADAANTLDQLPSPSAADDQAVIVHKVRLSGPNELESLLFGSATTSHPDTTVARIMKPSRTLSSSGNLPASGDANSLAHAYSWAAPGGFNVHGLGCYSTNTTASSRQQQRSNGWTTGGWAAAGMPAAVHYAPRRSASVNIAQLARQLHGSGSCSSSAASSQQSFGSLKVAGARESLAGAAGASRHVLGASASASRQSSSLDGLPPLAHKSSPSAAAALQGSLGQRQQLGRVPESDVQTSLLFQTASLPAGYVSKARSYQALSALQAAGSAELSSDSLAAALDAERAAASGKPPAGDGTMAAASADAAGLLGSRSGSGAGLVPAAAQQLPFRSAFRSSVHAPITEAPAALSGRFSDSAVLTAQQQGRQQPWRLSSASADAATEQQSSLHAQASLADSLASRDSSELGATEGKVHGGLAHSRSSSLKTLTATEALAAAAAAAAACDSEPLQDGASAVSFKAGGALVAAAAAADPSLAAGAGARAAEKAQRGSSSALAALEPLPAAAAATGAASSMLAAVLDEPSSQTPLERCVRGGHTRAARLKHSMSSPELQALVPGTKTRPRRSSVAQVPDAVLHSSAVGKAAAASHEQQGLLRHSATVDSTPSVEQDSSNLAGRQSVSPFAQDAVASSRQQLQQQQPVTFATAFAAAGACSLSSAGSRELTGGSVGADGAVHGGELGEQALEGQMHGGRRSKSVSNSLLLTSSLPSSADDDDDTLASSLASPGSRQQGTQAQGARPSNSYHSSLSCSSSSWRQLQLSPSGSGALPPAVAGLVCMDVSILAAAVPGMGGLQAFASEDGALTAVLPGSSSSTGGADNTSGSIQVMRMPGASGSFTRVRFAASAPAAAPGEQLSTVADALTDSPVGLLAGSVQHSAAGPGPLFAGYGSYSRGTVAAGPAVSSSGPWGTAAVKGWSSPSRHVVAFSSSAGSSGSAPGAATGLTNNSPVPALPKPAWSSSRAWSGKSAARKLNSKNLFAREAVSTPGAATGMALGTSAAAGCGSMGFSALLTQEAVASSSAAAAGGGGTPDSSSSGPDGAAPGALFTGDEQDPVISRGVSRQRSAPLPTLQESPCCTPGSSPVSSGFAAAYEQTLARHLGQLQQQQDRQQGLSKLVVLPPELTLEGHTAEDELTVGSMVLSSLEVCQPLQQQLHHQQQQQGSYAEHSATGLVMQSLTAEASRRSTDGSGSGSACTPGCSSEGLGMEGLRGALHSDSFEFSKPQGGETWQGQSPLLGKMLG